MTYEEYVAAAERHVHANDQRRGQAFFNVLDTHRPHMADQIRGTSLDPFYNNAVLSEFLQFVEEHWEVAEALSAAT